MSDYSRSSKPKKDKTETKKKISEGLNAFHKGLAILGSMLGLITASITIYNFTHKDDEKTTKDATPSTVIIQQGGNADSQTNTADTNSVENSTSAENDASTEIASETSNTSTDTITTTPETTTTETTTSTPQ